MRKLAQVRQFTPILLAVAALVSVLGLQPGIATAQQTPTAGARYDSGCVGDCIPSGFVSLDGQSNVVLENLHISNPNGRCLSINNASNITIRNSVIGPCGTNQGVSDGYQTGLITIENSANITLEGNLIEDIASTSTIHLRNNAVWITASPGVTILDNTFRDIHSDISQKSGDKGNRAIGVNGGSPNLVVNHNTFQNAGRNAFQYQRNYNVSGVQFSHNVIEGSTHWGSDYEDMINIYASTGTAASPIRIEGNFMRFGGPSSTGTGLIVGDGNPQIGTNAHVVVADNVIVNPGHVGIGVAGGSSIVVRDNIVYSEHHRDTLSTAVGMYVRHHDYGPTCDNISISNNRIYFVNQHVGGGTNHLWNAGDCSGATLTGNNIGDASLSMDVWRPGTPQLRTTPAASPVPATTTSTSTAAAATPSADAGSSASGPTSSTTTAPDAAAESQPATPTANGATQTSNPATEAAGPAANEAEQAAAAAAGPSTDQSATSPTTHQTDGAERDTTSTTETRTQAPTSDVDVDLDRSETLGSTAPAHATAPGAAPAVTGNNLDFESAPDQLALVEISEPVDRSAVPTVITLALATFVLGAVMAGRRLIARSRRLDF